MSRKFTPQHAVVLLLLFGVGFVSYYRFYARPVSHLEARLVNIRHQAAEFKKGTPTVSKISRARRDLESSFLSTHVDEFEHLLRTKLSALATEAGLAEVVVSHGQPSPVMNPILHSRIRQRVYKKPFRSKPDFYIVQGKLSGRGSTETLASVIALVQSQPWIHQIQSIKITPIGKQRRSAQLDLGFAVLYSPTASIPKGQSPQQASADPDTLRAAMSLASRPLFRPPDPEPAEPQIALQPQQPPPVPPPIPQDSYWRVTGIITEPTPEVWMFHTANAQQRVLKLQDSILNATLVEVHPDHAQFLIDSARFSVPLGSTLADRQSIENEEHSK